MPLDSDKTKLYYPPSADFTRYSSIDDARESTPENPLIEISIDTGYLVNLILGRLVEKDSQKTYLSRLPGAMRFLLPLREVLGSHKMAQVGGFEMGTIVPDNVNSLSDVTSPYITGVDYEKMIDMLYAKIAEVKDKVLTVIDLPEHVRELTQHRYFRLVTINRGKRVLTLSRAEIEAFSNPDWPARCIRDIQEIDGWTVLYIEDLPRKR